MRLDYKGIPEEGRDHHHHQATGCQGANIAIDLGQHVLQVVTLANLAPILVTRRQGQVIGQVVIPA